MTLKLGKKKCNTKSKSYKILFGTGIVWFLIYLGVQKSNKS